MLGGDMNEVRNMILTDDSISLDKRKTIADMRKKCYQVFNCLIKSELFFLIDAKKKPGQSDFLYFR